MKLAFVFLESVYNVNAYDVVPQFEHVNGSGQDMYIQIVSISSSGCANACDTDCPTRYMPSSAATLVANFDNLDSCLVVQRVAVMAFPADDRSIWKITIMPNDVIQGNMTLTLTDGTSIQTLLPEGRLVASGTGSNRFYA